MSQRTRSRARVAAWVALAAGAAAIAVLVVLLARDVVALGEALAALGVVGAGGWIALTRRGAVRVSALVVVLAALIAAAAAFVLRDALNELIAFAVALSIFAVATRVALRVAAELERSTSAMGKAPVARPGGRGRFALLMNPRSGGGKVERFRLVEEAERRGIEPILLEPGDDLVALAREAARSTDAIGMAGGDGSQALVAQVALQNELAYICVPAGTRNHLALDLGLDRDDVVGALDAFTNESEHRIDVAFVNERIFVNNVSLGIYAEIVQSEAYRDAKLQTMEKLLPGLLGPRATPFDLRFRSPEGEHSSAQLLLVSNNPYRLDRLAGMGSRPRLDSGLLGIVAVEINSAARAAELLALQALGQVRHFEGWREWTADEFEVESAGAIAAGIDGESVSLEPPLRFRVVPSALRVRIPRSAAGLSPAALAPGLNRSALRSLWQIAAGRG